MVGAFMMIMVCGIVHVMEGTQAMTVVPLPTAVSIIHVIQAQLVRIFKHHLNVCVHHIRRARYAVMVSTSLHLSPDRLQWALQRNAIWNAKQLTADEGYLKSASFFTLPSSDLITVTNICRFVIHIPNGLASVLLNTVYMCSACRFPHFKDSRFF